MKYIKNFKIFESKNLERDLIESLDDNIINDIYNTDYSYNDVEDIFKMNVDDALNYINEDKFFSEIIRDEISLFKIDDFDKYDYKKWIKNNTPTDIKEKVLEVYIKNNYDEDDDISDIEYDDSMLNELDKYELRDIIVNFGYEDDFVINSIESKYKNYNIRNFIDENFGDKYNNISNELYDLLKYYIKSDKLIKNFNYFIDYDSKVEILAYNIKHDKNIQKAIINNDNCNILKLSKILSGINSKLTNILNEYKYQKMYIEEYTKKKSNKKDIKAKAIKYINDNFKLNTKIEEEYPDDMWMVNADKFNL